MNPEKVGKFLKELRESKNISQYKLADIMHIDRSLVSKWENGKICPDQKYFEDLCKIYEIDVKELIEGERATEENEEELKRGIFRFFDLQDKKYKKVRRFSIGLIISLVTIIITFLAYYFYQTYNTIRIYKVYGQNENYKIGKGLLVLTRDNSYLNLGNIDFKYDKITIYSLKDEEKVIIFDNADIRLISDLPSYDSALNYDNFNNNINNIYVDITIGDKVETIQLHFDNEYVNKSFLFNDYKDTSDKNEEYEDDKSIPKYIRENYKCEIEICKYNNNNFEISYVKKTRIIIVYDKINNYDFEYDMKTNSLKYYSQNYSFTVENNVINCSKSNCDKEKEIYDQIFEKFLKPISQ